jgi:hypothetical protein
MKKKNAQTQSLLSQIWGLEIWSRKCFRLQPSPTPLSICICRGKTIRGIPVFFVGEHFHFQYLTTKKKKKKTSKIDHFSSKYGSSKLEEKLTHLPRGRWTPVRHSIRQGNMVRAFCKYFSTMQS